MGAHFHSIGGEAFVPRVMAIETPIRSVEWTIAEAYTPGAPPPGRYARVIARGFYLAAPFTRQIGREPTGSDEHKATGKPGA